MKNYYVLYEGENQNDNAMDTQFESLKKAQAAFRKTRYAYAVIFEYAIEGDFINSHDEKGLKVVA